MPHRGKRSKQGKIKQQLRQQKYRDDGAPYGFPLYNCRKSLEIFRLTHNIEYQPGFRNRLVNAVGVCVLCGFEDVNVLEVHHIDGNHSNNSWKNVTVVCSNCHTLITKRKLDYWDALTQRNLKIKQENRPISILENNSDKRKLS